MVNPSFFPWAPFLPLGFVIVQLLTHPFLFILVQPLFFLFPLLLNLIMFQMAWYIGWPMRPTQADMLGNHKPQRTRLLAVVIDARRHPRHVLAIPIEAIPSRRFDRLVLYNRPTTALAHLTPFYSPYQSGQRDTMPPDFLELRWTSCNALESGRRESVYFSCERTSQADILDSRSTISGQTIIHSPEVDKQEVEYVRTLTTKPLLSPTLVRTWVLSVSI